MTSNPLCKYKDLFGKPNEGLRKYRIGGIAMLDTVVVILIGIVFSYMTGFRLLPTLAILFISGIIVHRLFCVRSGIDRILFPDI